MPLKQALALQIVLVFLACAALYRGFTVRRYTVETIKAADVLRPAICTPRGTARGKQMH